MAQNKTRAHLPKPIPAMLEGSFGTTIENRIAELNNQLAREGRLTNDPLAVSLRNVRIALKEQGFTFERVLTGAAPTPVPVQTAAPVKRTTTTKATTPAVTTGPKAREIDEKQIDTLQVAGTVSEEASYGRDASGRALAPYGVKKDGIPMKRRGRVAAAPVAATSKPTAAAAAAATAEVDEEDAELESEVDAAQAALEASTEDDLDEEAPEGGASEEDLDDLLAGFE